MSNTGINDKDLEKLGAFVKENEGKRGYVAGMMPCDEFGVPLDGNHKLQQFAPVGIEDTNTVVVDAIQSGDVDCSYNVDFSFNNHWVKEMDKVFPNEQLEEFVTPYGTAEINYKHIDMPTPAILPAGAIYGTLEYPEIGGMKAVVGGLNFNEFQGVQQVNQQFEPAVHTSDRGITIPAVTNLLRENIMDVDRAVAESKPSGSNFNLRDHAHAFMLQKDKHKLNFKIYLNGIFKKNEKDLKDKFIKDLYSTKILYKEYKHLNFAAKRLILNNRLRANVIKYCSDMEIAATDILVLLENDSDIFTYIFRHLPAAIRKMIDRGIDL